MGGLTEAPVDTLIAFSGLATDAVAQRPALIQPNHGLFADLGLAEAMRTAGGVASVLMGHSSGSLDSDYTPKL